MNGISIIFRKRGDRVKPDNTALILQVVVFPLFYRFFSIFLKKR